MDYTTATLDNEQVKILNITGSEKNTSIAYIDSNNNLKVKVKPIDWTLQQSLSTSANPTSTSSPISSTNDQITYVGRQAGWNERILFQKYFGTSVNDNAQTIILASATGSQLIDGNYPNSLYGIPPVIRANFLNNKHKWIKSHFMFGLNLGNVSGAYYLIDEYWGDTKMCTITADYNYFPSPPTSAQNFPMEFFAWYNWDSGPASAAQIRVHTQMTANNVVAYDSVIRNKETYTGTYPIVDLTKDLPISWTAKCNLNSRKLYVDTLEYVC